MNIFRLMKFVNDCTASFNETTFALHVGEHFKAIFKRAYEEVAKEYETLSQSDKKRLMTKYPDFFNEDGVRKIAFVAE